jgi:hypothetical protein
VMNLPLKKPDQPRNDHIFAHTIPRFTTQTAHEPEKCPI